MARQQTQPERQPAKTASLVEQYRAIGPAAVLAALVCRRDAAGKQATTRKPA